MKYYIHGHCTLSHTITYVQRTIYHGKNTAWWKYSTIIGGYDGGVITCLNTVMVAIGDETK